MAEPAPKIGHPSASLGLDEVRSAAASLAGQILRTPALEAPKLSALADARVFIKYENLQATGSFKERGALLKLLSLDRAARKRGVIAISAGNHAQAVAYHARRLDIPATIVMPVDTPFNKVSSTEAYGATVILSGETVAESKIVADELRAQNGFTLVHPFDDPVVMAGQGTAGLEFLEDCPSLDALIVPIGGGGLISGVATAMKALRPEIEIFGVEVDSYPSTYRALRSEEALCGGSTLAEGIAVRGAGIHTLPIVRDLVSEIFLVGESQIEDAIFILASVQKTVAEGASAAALGALLAHKQRFAGKKVGFFQSGANIDSRVLASILIRGLERESKIVSLRLSVNDRPGILGEIATELGRCGANILEVHHRRMFLDAPAKGAVVELLIETKDKMHAEKTIERLRQTGLEVTRLNGASKPGAANS